MIFEYANWRLSVSAFHLQRVCTVLNKFLKEVTNFEVFGAFQ